MKKDKIKNEEHEAERIKVFICGAGQGGSNLLRVFLKNSLVEVVGICDINPEAEGLKLAISHNIPIYSKKEDIKGLLVDLAINVTGVPTVSTELAEIFPEAEVMGGSTAKLLFMLTEESERNYLLYEMLYQTSYLLLSKEQPREVLASIVNMAMKAADAPAGSIALHDEHTDEFYLATSAGFSKKFLTASRWMPRASGLTKSILDSKEQVYVVEDLEKTPIEIADVLKQERVKAIAAIPLRAGDELLGILYVDDFTPRRFSEQQRKALELLAQTAALALQKYKFMEKTKKLAVTDGLTGLNNYRYFQERLYQEISRAKRLKSTLSLVIFDIDHFKKYNDANGHLLGDEALKKIATIFKNNIRVSDTVVRYGGEEFALILPDTERNAARMVAERIRLHVENTRFEGEEALPLRNMTISAGVACFPEDAEEEADLIHKADNALYEAKQTGRNKVVMIDEIKDK